MLSIAHGLTGAFLATKLGHPLLFVPLCFAAHYLQDWIPHWDVGTGLSTGKRTKKTAILLELGDLALTGLILLWWWGPQGWPTLILAGIGCFAALLPDFLEAPRNFLQWEPRWLKPINNLHGLFHHSTPQIVLGVIPQLVTVLTLFLVK